MANWSWVTTLLDADDPKIFTQVPDGVLYPIEGDPEPFVYPVTTPLFAVKFGKLLSFKVAVFVFVFAIKKGWNTFPEPISAPVPSVILV